MINNAFPIKMEAAQIDNKTLELKYNAIFKYKKYARILFIVVSINLLSYFLQSLFPDKIYDIVSKVSGIAFLVLFVRTGFYFFSTIFLTVKTRNFAGGYIEVYCDHFIVKQRTRYFNNNQWENAEIWFEDLQEIWNATGKKTDKIYEYNLQYDRKMYVDEICFKFKKDSRSSSSMAVKTDDSIFRLHFGGYNKEMMFDLGKVIYSAALKFSPNLKYKEEPIVYKRIMGGFTDI